MDFGIEDVKRWQWALIGTALGFLLAYAQNEFGEEVPPATMDPYTFVSNLRRPPLQDGDRQHPWLDRIVVYPKRDGVYWVQAQLLAHTDKPRVLKYRTYLLTDWDGVPSSPWGGGGRGRGTGAAKSAPAQAAAETSVVAFLEQSSKQYPHVKYRYAWWAAPRNRMMTYTAAGLVVVGGIWPTLLGLLTGAGFGRAKQADPEYDLSRFKGEPAPAPAPPPAVANDDFDARLQAMEDELLAGLSNDVATRYEEPPAPVRTLKRGGAVDESEAVPLTGEQDKEYQGEFYPVALKAADKHEEHRP
jgi:hypothetical protein